MTRCNGIDIDQVEQFAGLVTTTPAAAKVTLRTRHRWDDAYAVTGDAHELHVAGEAIPRDHRVPSDRPAVFGGGDTGPAPGELLLSALAACVGSQLVEHAARRGVELTGVELSCEGRVDLCGTFDPDAGPPGLEGVDLHVDVGAAADDDLLHELLELAVATSPVAASLVGEVPVTPALTRTATPERS